MDISWIENKKASHKKLQQVFAKVINIKLVLHTKVIIEKSRGEVSLMEQDTIENVS